jgi:hypothetical protein
MVSVQFPPGVKHTVTAAGVVAAPGDGADGAGADGTQERHERQQGQAEASQHVPSVA